MDSEVALRPCELLLLLLLLLLQIAVVVVAASQGAEARTCPRENTRTDMMPAFAYGVM